MHCWHWQKSEKFQRPNSMVQTLGDDYDGKEGVGEGIVRVDDGKSWLMRPDNCIELVPFGRVVILKLSSTSYANYCTKYKHYGIQIQILQNTNINANTCFLLAELSSQASRGQPTATFCANCGTQYSRKLAFKVLLAPSGALIAIPTYYWSPPHFFRSHRSSTLDFHFLSHYSPIKAIMLYKGNHWTNLLATCIPYGYIRTSLMTTLAYSGIIWHTLA